jgi:hypothetical protein
MKLIDLEKYQIVVFGTETTDDDLTSLLEIYREEDLVYIPLEGTATTVLSADRFLVKNHDRSFINHMMWEGLLSETEQEEYMRERADSFFHTGRQMIIEDYDFQIDEVFYDYSK